MCASWRCVGLQLSKKYSAKPSPLLLWTAKIYKIDTRLPTLSHASHPTTYPIAALRPLWVATTWCPLRHGRRALGEQARKSPCLRRCARLTGRPKHSIGVATRIVCGCNHFSVLLLICVFFCNISHLTCSSYCRREEDRLRRETALLGGMACQVSPTVTATTTPTTTPTTSPPTTLTTSPPTQVMAT